MPFNYYRTKRPHEALLDLYIDEILVIVERRREPSGNNETPPGLIFKSNPDGYPAGEQCLVGSLTGAVASQKVTEASEGPLGPDGHGTVSTKA